MSEKLREPMKFLEDGQRGGIISCLVFAVQFLYTAAYAYGNNIFEKIMFVLLETLAFILAAELIRLLLRLILGRVKRCRLYFILSWAVLFLCNFVGNHGNTVVPAVLITFIAALAVDVLGRCGFSLIRRHGTQLKSAYVILGVALLIVCGFGAFYHLDCFGKDRIEGYLLEESGDSEGSEQVVSGFDEYLQNGDYAVGFMEYGMDSDKDIITGTLNLSVFNGKRGIVDRFNEWVSGYSLDETPIAGAIWYPEKARNCPTLFFVHGNHDYRTDSYLGYDYLGQYLASNGYVVVSVDENIINALGTGNDARAVLLLENIKKILQQNYCETSPLYGKIDADRIVIGGHSRGGEMAATAYRFNDMDAYPENGNLTFYYHFNISGVIAIAPTVDQYTPAGHSVELTDVNYLVLHGSNDHDVTNMMGEKQYNNVTFTGDTQETYFKSSVYIMGANHGQFNSLWGRYDLTTGVNGFLNTCNFLEEEEQHTIAQAYIRAFLDSVIGNETEYADLLENNERYRNSLPETVYITNYMDSNETVICGFDSSIDPKETDLSGVGISCTDMKKWGLTEDSHGTEDEEENHVLFCEWNEGSDPVIEIDAGEKYLEAESISLRIADMREDSPERTEPLSFTVELEDENGIVISSETDIYPSLAIQLYKEDVLFNCYEYRHQLQTVKLTPESFEKNKDFDFGAIRCIRLRFDGSGSGEVILDEIAISKEE